MHKTSLTIKPRALEKIMSLLQLLHLLLINWSLLEENFVLKLTCFFSGRSDSGTRNDALKVAEFIWNDYYLLKDNYCQKIKTREFYMR